MSSNNGEIRRSQVITTFGPGALIDMPDASAIVGGLATWNYKGKKEEHRIHEPRLSAKVGAISGLGNANLFAPPGDDSMPWEPGPNITAWKFPNWFIVQKAEGDDGGAGRSRSRRLVHRSALDGHGRYSGEKVVATRFVRACTKGHVDDLDWRTFSHEGQTECNQPLWLDEQGTGGDLADLVVRCQCGARRPMNHAMKFRNEAEAEGESPQPPLGYCNGERPWLGRNAREDCQEWTRLLVRTATNAYFSMMVSVLSLPETRPAIVVQVELNWNILEGVTGVEQLEQGAAFLPAMRELVESFGAAALFQAIQDKRDGTDSQAPVKQAELDAILLAPNGYGDDVPMDPNFHARRLPESVWRKSELSDPIAAVVQLHRLREVTALTGFTRFEPLAPDIHGEYDSDVEPAGIDLDPTWFPAVENRGEGIFVLLDTDAVKAWSQRPAVRQRLDALAAGYERWKESRKAATDRPFVGGPYVLLHTLSHLVMQSLAMSCGYPSSSLKERIYVEKDKYGFLLYTGSPDAEGTLGGLVQEARNFERHLADALRQAALCSNDPICANHDAGESMEGRWLHGASCHGCSLLAETSCEMRNDYLDRALVVPVLGHRDTAFFPEAT